MSSVDDYLIGALRQRDFMQQPDDPISTVVSDCSRAVRTAIAARKRATELTNELQAQRMRAGSTSPSAGAPGASAAAEREVAQLKDRIIALQEKNAHYMESRSEALDRAGAAEDRARAAEARASLAEASLSEARGTAVAAMAAAESDSRECEILRAELQALRERAVSAEEAAITSRAEQESLLARFVREKAAAAAQINALTEELRVSRSSAGTGSRVAPPPILPGGESGAGGGAVDDEVDAVLMTHLVGGSGGAGEDAPRTLVKSVAGAHKGQATAAVYAPNGAVFVTAGVDGAVVVWDGVTGRRKGEARATAGSAASAGAAHSPLLCVDVLGGSIVAGSSDKIVRVWDLETGRSTHAMAGHTGQVVSVRAMGDGRLLLSAAADRTLRLWDVRAHRPVRTMATASVPRCADVTGDGSFAVVGHLNKSLRVFDLGRAAPVAELSGAHSKLVMSVAYSHGDASSRVLSYGQEGAWRLLAAATLAPLGAGVAPAGAAAAASDAVSLKGFRPWSKRGQASLSPLTRGGGYVAATGDDGRIGLWRSGDGHLVRCLQGGHPCSATAVAWAPDCRRLVSVDCEGGLCLWQ